MGHVQARLEGGVRSEGEFQAEETTCAMPPLGRKEYILLLRGTESSSVRLQNRAPVRKSRKTGEAQPMVTEGFLQETAANGHGGLPVGGSI